MESYDGCLKTKGCFGLTPDCVEKKNCLMMVSYRPSVKESGQYDFVLQSTGILPTDYVAVGISADAYMGNDVVFACSESTEVGST